MTLDHKLRPFKVVALDVIDIDRAIAVVLRQGGCVLPSKQVVRALTCGHIWVQRAKLEAIKFAIDKGRSLLLVFTLLGEASLDTTEWLGEVIVTVDLDLVGLIGCLRRCHPQASALIGRPFECLEGFLGRLAPDPLSDSAPSLGVHNMEVGVVGRVLVKFLASDDKVVSWRVPEGVNVL